MTWEEIKARYRKETPLLAEAVDIAVKMVTDMDMVEVVRCKDCRWVDPMFGICKNPTVVRCEAEINPSDFCSKGERTAG